MVNSSSSKITFDQALTGGIDEVFAKLSLPGALTDEYTRLPEQKLLQLSRREYRDREDALLRAVGDAAHTLRPESPVEYYMAGAREKLDQYIAL